VAADPIGTDRRRERYARNAATWPAWSIASTGGEMGMAKHKSRSGAVTGGRTSGQFHNALAAPPTNSRNPRDVQPARADLFGDPRPAGGQRITIAGANGFDAGRDSPQFQAWVDSVERPELRKFGFNPLALVLADRGAYLGAIFTIIRAYRAAGSPKVCEPLGSYGEWTAMVRAPLMWLGKADPVASMEAARDEDSDLTDVSELLGLWRDHLGNGGAFTALEIRQVARQYPEFHDLLLRVAGDKSGISTKRLGAWLRRIQGRIVGGFRLVSRPGRAGGHAPSFFMQRGRQTEG
jgi:hypothetical protein